jgi:hypothetical protein
MQLKELSFIFPAIDSALIFKAVETVISPDEIAQTLGNTNSVEERKRKLPSYSNLRSNQLQKELSNRLKEKPTMINNWLRVLRKR